MRDDISVLEEELISQGSYVTDRMTGDYAFVVDPSIVQLNSVAITAVDMNSPITILAGGHLYGSPYNAGTPLISSTVQNNIDTINSSQADLFFSLGDMTYLPSMESVQGLRDILLDRVTVPLFNAVGNHDLKNGRTFYQNNFGQTYYSFEYGSLQIVVLDTVISHCYIEGHQLDMLNSVLEDTLQNNNIQNIFIFVHKLIFLEDEDLMGRANGMCDYGSNFSQIRDDILIPFSLEKPIYIFAGDVGAFGGNLSPFYYRYPDSNLSTIAVGVGDGVDDALLKIVVEGDEVKFELIPLADGHFHDLTTYTPAYWLLQPH
jgi:3',5'-cyclic AMP phosphodiesterase CpdA